MKGVVLGGTASGVGKTVATLATITALDRAGHAVQPAKAGPDFIDPSHHERVAGRPSRTLDVWMQGEDGLRRNYHRGEGDVCVVEGVMGLYDGGVSSTARVAAALDLLVLVVDASAGMESVAATALGFREYAAHAGVDADVVGVIASRAHGGRHERGIREALPDDIAYLGRVPPDPDLEIPDRHLGLHMGAESPVPESALSAAANHLDADALVDLARTPLRPTAAEPARERTHARVAVARDAAFRFCYPATLERLAERATVPFAPTTDDALPDCDAVYLPGLPRTPRTRAGGLQRAGRPRGARRRPPVLGECGGSWPWRSR